jgi:hypothetical protein
LLDHMGRRCLVLQAAVHLPPKPLYYFAFPPAISESSCVCFGFCRIGRSVVLSLCPFNSQFPNNIDYWASFKCLFALCVFFAELSTFWQWGIKLL